MTTTPAPVLRKRYVDTGFGQMHLVECGAGDPVVLLHQTPRSWREYAAVLPLIGASARAVAVDTLGFGQSADLDGPASIEVFADAVIAVLDGLGLPTASLVGHHTGGVIALEVAARLGGRIPALVLSAVPFVDAARRQRVRNRPPIDWVAPSSDGTHLAQLWRRRQMFYPVGSGRLLTRFVADGLRAGERVEDGHLAVNRYHMEDRLPLIRSRCLLLCGREDHYSLPDQRRLQAALQCPSVVIDGGVPLPEQRPADFAHQVLAFITLR
jgi:pimeloyl-ACP methyl ester carboxylesterase